MKIKRPVLILINLILLNLLLWRGGVQWDVSEEEKHSLSPKTPELLQQLKGKSKVYFIASEEKQAAELKPLSIQIKDFVRTLKDNSLGKIEIEFINPDEDFEKRTFVENHFGVKRLEVKSREDGTRLVYFSVVIESGNYSKVFNEKDLVFFDPFSTRNALMLNDLEPLFLRNLFRLNRKYDNFQQALAQAKEKQLTLITIASKKLSSHAKSQSLLVEKKVRELALRFPDSLKHVQADINDETTKTIIEKSEILPYPTANAGQFYMHLLIQQQDGSYTNVPDLLMINSVEGIDEAIKQRILLTLEKGERQLGLLLPKPVTSPWSTGPRQLDHYQMLKNYLGHHYQVRQLTPPLLHIPPGVSTLMVMGIDHFDTPAVEELDRFVSQGGRLLLFVDRHVTHFNLKTFFYELHPQDNGLEKLLESWGIILTKNVGFATNASSAVALNWPKKVSSSTNRIELIPLAHPGVPLLNDLPTDLGIFKGVKSVLCSYPNSLNIQTNTDHTITPLLPGKTESVIAIPVGSWISPLNADGSLNLYRPTQEIINKAMKTPPVFGALLEGKFKSVESDNSELLSPDTKIALIADSDFFSGNFYFGPHRGKPDTALQGHLYLNQTLLRNLVDWSFGDDELLEVSSRKIKIRQLDLEHRKRAEIVAISLPLALLLIIGFWRWFRRRSS